MSMTPRLKSGASSFFFWLGFTGSPPFRWKHILRHESFSPPLFYGAPASSA